MADTDTPILDRAWRAVDALGGTHAPEDAEYGRGYDDALTLACAEIAKLGGMDPLRRLRASEAQAEAA